MGNSIQCYAHPNNKLKVVKRRCYGILNVTHFFQRIQLDLYGHSLFAMKIIEV